MPESNEVTVEGARVVPAKVRTYRGGATFVVGDPITVAGFVLPPKTNVDVDSRGHVKEARYPAAVNLGAVGLKKGATLGRDGSRLLAFGLLAKKTSQGDLTLAAGDPVRVLPDGTIAVAFPSKATKMGGKTWPESSRFEWNGSTWRGVEESTEYVPEADVEEDDEDDED